MGDSASDVASCVSRHTEEPVKPCPGGERTGRTPVIYRLEPLHANLIEACSAKQALGLSAGVCPRCQDSPCELRRHPTVSVLGDHTAERGEARAGRRPMSASRRASPVPDLPALQASGSPYDAFRVLGMMDDAQEYTKSNAPFSNGRDSALLTTRSALRFSKARRWRTWSTAAGVRSTPVSIAPARAANPVAEVGPDADTDLEHALALPGLKLSKTRDKWLDSGPCRRSRHSNPWFQASTCQTPHEPLGPACQY